ncbi:unnamed protein product [Agarophyton chilense]|eukprot:gb/GEZJ01003112.1/.p1 GENE.gb/GEZJ01003112.1/~~gb/GEZJ01003112.1/.p1  ORF type:complete len:189 (+),score=31.15 gb/GEZJ01003112.1/:1049-1615(+)
MDASVVAAIKILPSCSESIELLATAASAARQASNTAKIFHEDGDTVLAAARMLRCEKLLKSIRETLADISSTIKRAEKLIDLESNSTPTNQGQWNKLSDAWWLERARGIHSRLQTVSERESAVSRLLSKEQGMWGLFVSYGEVVNEIADAVENLTKSWNGLISYTDEWKDIAIAVYNGIGESGSLIPS